MSRNLSDPKVIAELGEKIYADHYRAEYEARYRGQFVLIDVNTDKAYRGQSAEEAYAVARQDAPHGIFHLIKVGEPGAYRLSYSSNARMDWVFR